MDGRDRKEKCRQQSTPTPHPILRVQWCHGTTLFNANSAPSPLLISSAPPTPDQIRWEINCVENVMHLQNIPDYFTKLHFVFSFALLMHGVVFSPPTQISQTGDRALSKKVSLINFHLTKKYHPTCFDSHLSWFKEKRSFHYRRNQLVSVISILKFINEGMKEVVSMDQTNQ